MIVEIRVADTPRGRWVGWIEGFFSLNHKEGDTWEEREEQAVYQFRHKWRQVQKEIDRMVERAER